MLQGLYPFLTTNEDELVHKIKKGSYKFIKPISESSKNLIKLMLNPVPCERIPLKSIREHHWLQDESEDD
jgi:serine/threonine protein kinase